MSSSASNQSTFFCLVMGSSQCVMHKKIEACVKFAIAGIYCKLHLSLSESWHAMSILPFLLRANKSLYIPTTTELFNWTSPIKDERVKLTPSYFWGAKNQSANSQLFDWLANIGFERSSPNLIHRLIWKTCRGKK